MSEKKHPLTERVEDTMACTGFAEEGEPCPIDFDEAENSADDGLEASAAETKSVSDSVEDTMACTAYADENEPCPIDTDDKE